MKADLQDQHQIQLFQVSGILIQAVSVSFPVTHWFSSDLITEDCARNEFK